MGERLRAYCTGKNNGEKYGGTAALSSIAIERVFDGLIISVKGVTGLFFVPVTGILFHSLLIVSSGFAVLTVGLIVSILFHQTIRRSFHYLHRKFPGNLTRFGKEKIIFFLDGLLLLNGPPVCAAVLILTALIWGAKTVSCYFIANAVFPGVSFRLCFLFLAVANFASLFPFTIGGIGAVEGIASLYLVNAGVPNEQALAMVVIQHFFQFSFTTLIGEIFYFSGGYYNFFTLSEKRNIVSK